MTARNGEHCVVCESNAVGEREKKPVVGRLTQVITSSANHVNCISLISRVTFHSIARVTRLIRRPPRSKESALVIERDGEGRGEREREGIERDTDRLICI